MEFVEGAKVKLLQTGAAIECKTYIPFVVNPLTVSVNASGRKWLILDLRPSGYYQFPVHENHQTN